MASRELAFIDTVPIIALVVLILALAFYPQFGLRRSQPTVRATLSPTHALTSSTSTRIATASR